MSTFEKLKEVESQISDLESIRRRLRELLKKEQTLASLKLLQDLGFDAVVRPEEGPTSIGESLRRFGMAWLTEKDVEPGLWVTVYDLGWVTDNDGELTGWHAP